MRIRYNFSTHILSILFLLLIVNSAALAQGGTGTVKGRILNNATKAPVHDVQITVVGPHLEATTNPEGFFTILDVPVGSQSAIISASGMKKDTVSVTVTAGVTDMGEIMMAPGEQTNESAEIPTISIEENTSQEDENSSSTSQSSVGFYAANNDPFLYTASFIFGPFRFKPRGYDNADVEVNGVPLQDLESGFASTSLIGGLNDVMRDRNITYGLKPAEYSFGTVKGSTYISATAADQRPGTSISYQLSNGSFRNRLMVTHSSGVSKKGWAYSLSGSRRWAQEGYVPGTFYDAFSFYGAVSKVTKKGQFNLTAFGAPTKRGKATSETDEVFDLTGNHYYNGYWGYQNGEKRNANVANSFQPVIAANYTYKPSENTRWNTAVGYEFGKYKSSSIDFYNGYSPNPTYYKNMPSYYLYGNSTPNPAEADAIRAQYVAHPEQLHIQWDNLYNDNYTNNETIYNVNGIAGNDVTGKRSIFVVSDAVDDLKKLSFNSNITHVVNSNITINGGVTAISQRDEYYKQLTDLMGGDFYVNYNQFATLSTIKDPLFLQNDLNHPNALVKTGDKYNYDYILRALQTKVWAQGLFSYEHFDFFITGEGGLTSFSREGLMRNGLFPDNSYGKSATHSFTTYKVKGGVTYNINPKNSIYAHAAYFNDAPKIDYTYISDKTRDFVVGGAKTYVTKSFEIGYLFKTSRFNCRLTGYATDITGNTIIKRFFNDESEVLGFVNYIMQNVNTRSIGTELVAGYKISKSFSATAVAAVGQTFYTDNPNVSVYLDNSPTMVPVKRNVYLSNYYLGVGPQSIYSLGLRYNSRKYWHANLNVNYMDRNYVEVNPGRRTQEALDLVPPGSQQWKDIVAQERLPSAYTVDISAGKSFNLSKYLKFMKSRTLLNVNIGVNNLLNNTDIKTTAYEQLRFDYNYANPKKFPNKYGYGYGTTFYINLGLKF